MRYRNPFIIFFSQVLFPFLFVFAFALPAHPSECGSCMRRVQVMIRNDSDIAFDAPIFLRHFGAYFRSPCVQIGANLPQPEYVAAGTFIKEENYNRVHLGIILGFVGGEVGNVRKQREWWTQTNYDYYGDMVSLVTVHAEGDSLDDVIPLMLEKLKQEEPIDLTMRRYEQIPTTAETEDNLDCEGRGTQIKLHGLDSGYPRYGFSSSHMNRIVVHAENGRIEHGVALEDDDRSKVFELSPHTDRNREISFTYDPPEGEEKSDTIIFYNSCDVLHEDVLPLSRTRKNIEIARVELRCVWEGTIASAFTMAAKGDESLLTALMPKSQYLGMTNWKLDVVFKLDRGNERVKIYELKSAEFDFMDQLTSDFVMKGEAGKTQLTGKSQTEASGQKLSPSECNLELIIDLKKKTYKIEGVLHVENIQVTGDGRLIVNVGPIRHDQMDQDQGTTEYREEILIEGKFQDEMPEKLEGSIDEMKEMPPDFAEFMEALAGKLTGKMRWNLEWKGKQ